MKTENKITVQELLNNFYLIAESEQFVKQTVASLKEMDYEDITNETLLTPKEVRKTVSICGIYIKYAELTVRLQIDKEDCHVSTTEIKKHGNKKMYIITDSSLFAGCKSEIQDFFIEEVLNFENYRIDATSYNQIDDVYLLSFEAMDYITKAFEFKFNPTIFDDDEE